MNSQREIGPLTEPRFSCHIKNPELMGKNVGQSMFGYTKFFVKFWEIPPMSHHCHTTGGKTSGSLYRSTNLFNNDGAYGIAFT